MNTFKDKKIQELDLVFSSKVHHMGWNNFNGKDAYLEWHKDNRIRLIRYLGQGDEIIFDQHVSEVIKAKVSVSKLKLKLPSGKYNLSFDGNPSLSNALASVQGMFRAEIRAEEEGIFWWFENFKKFNIKTRRVSAWRNIFYGVAFLPGVIILGLLYNFIKSLFI